MKKNKGILLALFLISIFGLPFQTFGADSVKKVEKNKEVSYSVTPILPKNQLKRGRAFFDLRVKPGDKQTIKLLVNNFSKQEQTYEISVNTAQTNGSVLIDYSDNKLPQDTPNKLPIGDYVEYPETITIPGEKTGVVSFDISIPKKQFSGIQLGGIQVKKDFSKERNANKSILFSEYAYVIGLMLSEDDLPVSPQLEYIESRAEVITNNAGIKVYLKNSAPINIKDVKVTANIYKGNQKQAQIKRSISNGDIAPQSFFGINLFNGEAGSTRPLTPGKYSLDLKVEDKLGNKWHFTDKFSLTATEAKKINKKVFKKDTNWKYVLYAIIAILLLLLLIVLFLLLKSKQVKKIESK